MNRGALGGRLPLYLNPGRLDFGSDVFAGVLNASRGARREAIPCIGDMDAAHR